MMAKARSTILFFMMLLDLSDQVEGANCEGTTNLINMCQQVTVTNKIRYTMEFSTFAETSADSCQCSFIAPSEGDFVLSPTGFVTVNSCGTEVEISLNDIPVNGGKTACKSEPLVPAQAVTGDKVAVTVRRTLSTSIIAPYCFVATFPDNVTFSCSEGVPMTDATTSVSTTRQTTTITTTPTTTTITTTITPATSKVSSSSPTSLMPKSSSISSNIRTDPSTKEEQVGVPMTIVIPAAIGGAVVIVIIIVVAVVCSRRSRTTKQTTRGKYENEVFNDKDSSSDGIKDNILYNGMGDNVPHRESGGDGHYCSIIRHSSKLDEEPHNMKQLPQPVTQQAETQGPVYAVVDKSQKRPSGPPVASKPPKSAQNDSTAAPVYAVPDKSQIKSKQKVNSGYDVPQNNSPVSIPSPPIRTSNQDGLLYSEVQHVGPIPDLPTRKSDSKPADTVIYSEIRTEL